MADNTRQLSSSALLINNEVVEYKAETLEYDYGLGEEASNMVNSGGRARRIPGQNIQSEVAMISFEIQSTDANRNAILGWKRNNPNNAISIEDRKTGSVLNYTGASITNNPKIKEASDGTINVEFEANPPFDF